MTLGEYSALATAQTPALIIYVIDISRSMMLPLGGKRRIDVVRDALQRNLQRMVFLSTRGNRVSPRYHIAVLAYSQYVYELTHGIQPIDHLASLDVPQLQPESLTDTYAAFLEVENLLKQHIDRYETSPAPLICHLTDGEHNSEKDPLEVVKRIRAMRVRDGAVLVENIYINNTSVLVNDWGSDMRNWQGITANTQFTNDDSGKYAHVLRKMSSPIPASYRRVMNEQGYHIAPDAMMMLPGHDLALLEMGFVMSASTRIR